MLDETKLNCLIDDWIAARDAAAELLVHHLGLASPRDILMSQHRGRRPIGDSGWQYRTHGCGVDVTNIQGRCGIDFDFSDDELNIYANPDWYRLQLFARRAVHDKMIRVDRYSTIIDDISAHSAFVEAVIAKRFSRLSR
ncbi:hypothetical protein GC163_21400 [bacterium]|nr:hypothetical protein [bacterium]